MATYTKLPNHIVDAMPDMGKAELKVTIAIVRHTYGFHKESCELTFSELQELTGMSRGGVAAGVKSVVDRGFFSHEGSAWVVCQSDQNGLVDEPNSGLMNRPEQSSNYTESVYSLDQSGLVNRPKSVYLLDQNTPVLKKKENIKESPPVPQAHPLEAVFTEQTGIMPNAGVYAELWQPYFDNWQRRYGDKADEMIRRAVHFSRRNNDQRKKYTVTSPQSLATIMANLEAEGAATNGQIVIGAR